MIERRAVSKVRQMVNVTLRGVEADIGYRRFVYASVCPGLHNVAFETAPSFFGLNCTLITPLNTPVTWQLNAVLLFTLFTKKGGIRKA
jgi:hypothetical protein